MDDTKATIRLRTNERPVGQVVHLHETVETTADSVRVQRIAEMTAQVRPTRAQGRINATHFCISVLIGEPMIRRKTMKLETKCVVAALCIVIMVAFASTAGCTSSSTPSNQASGNPTDTTKGSDPNPSVMPRYNSSQRTEYMDYPDHGSTAYTYETKDNVSQVSSFYKAQMPKLGYTVKVLEDRSDYSLIKYQQDGKTVVGMMLLPTVDGNTTIGVVVNGANSDYSTMIGS